MKILAAGDLHGDTKRAQELADRAEKENVDYVVLCGDLTFAERSTEGIIGPFVKKGKKVIFVPGNHETFATADFLAELYGAKNLHGYSVKTKDQIGLFGCGGANIGLSQLSENEIFDTLKKGFENIKGLTKTIMVTHVHPSETKMDLFTQLPGSKGVTQAIKTFKPNILLCSHVHEAEGIEEMIGNTRVINVGKKGKIIEL